ncbi:ABC transporter substrate-binding protein [Paenibacillus endoradicis]|uniref:ABC transporter substrate-binding protein n=1 Tax=Paenibacillus endoradicis TaxID=2972487 RepID=UPI0021591BFA|nr:ABC transporter substrate-binding protein [Paenibacillus endoradicis]MCR8659922.1 ABC transporter substrate-binding protein [Paenibacillus endoradicis]
MERKTKLFKMLMVMMVCSVLVLSACGKANEAPITPKAPETSEAAEEGVMDWAARKALNEAVGEITYITGFYYAASPPDIQVVMASELGYFEEMGLNVKIIPGLDAEGMKFLAAGQAQIASAGTPSLVIQSAVNGAGIKGIATFGGTGTSAIMVMKDSGITEPKDLVGKTIGYHGALPANIVAMFNQSDVDVMSVKGVSVGYDPTVLSAGKVDALTVYKSNEPYLMKQMGVEVSILDPGQFGAETSFGVLAVNDKFATENPTVVEDFLRAVSKAHDYAAENPEKSLEALSNRSDSVYDLATETNRWSVELDIVNNSRIAGHGVAWQTNEQWEREIDILFGASVIREKVTVDKVMNNTYIDAIYEGEQLIWPE